MMHGVWIVAGIGNRRQNIIIVFNKIPTMQVINIAITIIINPVARNLARIGPKCSPEILVINVGSGINDRDRYRFRTGGYIPAAWSVYLIPDRLLLRILRIIGYFGKSRRRQTNK